MQHKLPRSPSDQVLMLTQFNLSASNRRRLWGLEHFCETPFVPINPKTGLLRWNMSEENKRFRAAMCGLNDKTKLFFLPIAATVKRYPCAGSATDQVSLGLLRDMQRLKGPGQVANDYGKCSDAIVLPGKLFIPETLRGRLLLCDVQSPQEFALAYLLGTYQTEALKRQHASFSLLERMVAPDALFVYFKGRDVVLFVDTEDMVEGNPCHIKYSIYAIDYNHMVSRLRPVGSVLYYLAHPK